MSDCFLHFWGSGLRLDGKFLLENACSEFFSLLLVQMAIKCFKKKTFATIEFIWRTFNSYLIFVGYFWNYFGYCSLKVFNADIFKNNSSLRQKSNISCNLFTLQQEAPHNYL